VRSFVFVPIRLCLAFLLMLGVMAAPVRGQDEPVKMTPEFPLIFPLAKNGEDVTVKYPVLLNPATVLKPGMVMRTLYIINYNPVDDSTDLMKAHDGTMEEAYSRQPTGTSSNGDVNKLPPELAHEIEGYRRTVWQAPNNFVLAMAQYPTDMMHLIYSPTGKMRDLADARFNFFDGLFVGLPEGKVTVLAVEDDSKAHEAGIKAGDEIVSVGGNPTRNDLEAFAAAYAHAKDVAKENEATTYVMTVRSPGETEPHQVGIAMPPQLKGGLMDGFK